MSTTSRAAAGACSQCRLVLPSRRSLRRHEALDHRAAPDGAQLTARLVGGQPSEPEPAAAVPAGGAAWAGVLAQPPVPPAADPRPTAARGPSPTGPLVVAVLVALVALALGTGPVAALTGSVLVWLHWVRWHPSAGVRAGPPQRQPRRPTSP